MEPQNNPPDPTGAATPELPLISYAAFALGTSSQQYEHVKELHAMASRALAAEAKLVAVEKEKKTDKDFYEAWERQGKTRWSGKPPQEVIDELERRLVETHKLANQYSDDLRLATERLEALEKQHSMDTIRFREMQDSGLGLEIELKNATERAERAERENAALCQQAKWNWENHKQICHRVRALEEALNRGMFALPLMIHVDDETLVINRPGQKIADFYEKEEAAAFVEIVNLLSTPATATETPEQTFARHKSEELANSGRSGLPQGPCQCNICKQVRTATATGKEEGK